jgi:hypothetical protein
MADPAGAMSGVTSIISFLSKNRTYAMTYGKYFQRLHSQIKEIVKAGPNTRSQIAEEHLPRLQEVSAYMSKNHSRLYKQLRGALDSLKTAISPPPDEPEPQGIWDKFTNLFKKKHPTDIEKPMQVFSSKARATPADVVDVAQFEADSIQDAESVDSLDAELATLRKYGPFVYDQVKFKK